MKSLKLFLLLAVSSVVPGVATAATSGVVRGRLTYYNELGNFCPSTRTCGAARYHQASFGTDMPVKNVKVKILDSSATQIGTGRTDSDGWYTVSWFSGSNATQGHLNWNGEHADGRFNVRDGSGSTLVWYTNNSSITNGTTTGSPQQWGTANWGWNGNESALSHVYAGAERTWADSFTYSGHLGTHFTNVEIRGFSSDCPTSCASGKLVKLDTAANTPYGWSSRVAHELGHIASTQSSQQQNFNLCANYTFGGGNTWNATSAEHGCAHYEEAFATWVGDVARYWSWDSGSTDICPGVPTGACATLAEPSTVALGGTCALNEDRTMQSTLKFFWDVYDSGNDSESVQEDYWQIVFNNTRFAVGTANRQRDEWQAGDLDGRGTFDYYWNYWTGRSVSLTNPWWNNCAPVGD